MTTQNREEILNRLDVVIGVVLDAARELQELGAILDSDNTDDTAEGNDNGNCPF